MASSSARMWRASPLTYLAICAVGLLSIYPLYYVIVIATRSADAINSTPPPFTPGSSFFANLGRALDKSDVNFWLGLQNSVVVSSVITVSVVLTSTLAGFAFAKLKFRGRDALLFTILVTMMIPTQLGLIPLWGMMLDFDWYDSLYAVIVPFLTSAFGVFMMRQYASSAVSEELIEAARVDGCSTLRTFWNVVLPAVRPAAGVLALLTFMEQWNSFLSMVFAATAVATLPLVVVFIVFGRQIIGGIMEGAIKA
jgi:cellobiose transport system permease protein